MTFAFARRFSRTALMSGALGLVLVGAMACKAVPQSATRLSSNSAQLALQTVEKSPPESDEAITRFVAFGDMGSRLPGQYRLSNAMVQAYQQQPYGFVLMLGDLIYPDGNVRKYGEASFTQPYLPLLKAGVKFYAALGNHDVDSGFINDSMTFFSMPSRYYAFTEGNIRGIALDTNRFDEVQRQWLKKTLAQPLAPGQAPYWTIVFAHHPVYSSGLHGNSAVLIKDLKPILENAHVDLYLTGHDHDYERFRPVNGVTYIVSGGGGASLRPFRPLPVRGSLIRKSVFEFVRFEATPDTLTFTTLDAQSSPIDSGILRHEGIHEGRQAKY